MILVILHVDNLVLRNVELHYVNTNGTIYIEIVALKWRKKGA